MIITDIRNKSFKSLVTHLSFLQMYLIMFFILHAFVQIDTYSDSFKNIFKD